jgi:hypothetical protein
MKKSLLWFMSFCLGRPSHTFSNKDIVFFYTAFIVIMSILSYLDVGVRM